MFWGFIGGLCAFALCRAADVWWAKRGQSRRFEELRKGPRRATVVDLFLDPEDEARNLQRFMRRDQSSSVKARSATSKLSE